MSLIRKSELELAQKHANLLTELCTMLGDSTQYTRQPTETGEHKFIQPKYAEVQIVAKTNDGYSKSVTLPTDMLDTYILLSELRNTALIRLSQIQEQMKGVELDGEA